jgi:hypothetical protein
MDPGVEDPLGDRLEAWLEGPQPKTMRELADRFGPQSFAILFVVLMAVPALPLPTGGVTHVLEIVTILIASQLILGRTEVWIPRRWLDRNVPALSNKRFAAALLKRVRWFEKVSHPRGARMLEWRITTIVYGAIVIGLTTVAFLAPPFSGLDTLPSMGVVILSLGVLFGDVVIAGVGIGIGSLGVALVVGLGHVISKLV